MDPSSLRAILSKTDVTPVTIQASSRAIMKQYDKSPTNAVNEWRNSIQTCQTDQLLPMLYVANEVLQTSKRNRGNKFLEAFSPVLATSTRFICERDRSICEKVRRVIKIWGDRRVFSQRFVGELLNGLEGFRKGPTSRRNLISTKKNNHRDSPIETDSPEASPFGSQGPSLLQVDVEMKEKPTRKRLRETNAAPPVKKAAIVTPSQKIKVYSTSTLLDLLRRTETLSSEFDSSKSIVEGCPSSHFTSDNNFIADLVGDDLVKMHDDVKKTGRLLIQQRKKMHAIAKERKDLEADAVKFIPFLKDSLKQDDDELLFCDQIEEKIQLLSLVIGTSFRFFFSFFFS